MFADKNITLQAQDEQNTELVFPVSLVERAETFDALMGDVAEAIEAGDDPRLALDDNHIRSKSERQTLKTTIAAMRTPPLRGPQPHLGLLHSQPRPSRRLGPG